MKHKIIISLLLKKLKTRFIIKLKIFKIIKTKKKHYEIRTNDTNLQTQHACWLGQVSQLFLEIIIKVFKFNDESRRKRRSKWFYKNS